MSDPAGGTAPTAAPGPSNPAQVAATRLTTPSGRASAPLGGPKPKKRRKKKSQASSSAATTTSGGPRGGRVVLPASASTSAANSTKGGGPSASTPAPQQPRSRKKIKGGRKALSSQASAFQKQGPGPAQNQDAPPDNFAAVASQTGQVAFTRPRGDALNSSIASVLGRRPAEVLEEHQRELRTKRQKTAAESLRRELLMDVDDSSSDEAPVVPAQVEATADDANAKLDEEGAAVGAHTARIQPQVSGEDADPEDLVVETTTSVASTVMGAPSVKSPTTAAATVDIFDAGQQKAPSFPPPKPFSFPQGQRGEMTSPPSHASEAVAHVAEPDDAPATQPTAPLAPATTAPSVPVSAPSEVPAAVPAAKAFDDLPKALPLLHGAQPKLKSAAAVLAGKRRKKKLKPQRAPQLFDYLSDEMSDDWEDKEDKYKAPKRPKNGKAVDGRLETNEDEDEKAKSGAETSEGTEANPNASEASTARKLIPTSYQAALLERAKESNILTVLSTGSGKTLVAVSLRRMRENRRRLLTRTIFCDRFS